MGVSRFFYTCKKKTGFMDSFTKEGRKLKYHILAHMYLENRVKRNVKLKMHAIESLAIANGLR